MREAMQLFGLSQNTTTFLLRKAMRFHLDGREKVGEGMRKREGREKLITESYDLLERHLSVIYIKGWIGLEQDNSLFSFTSLPFQETVSFLFCLDK